MPEFTSWLVNTDWGTPLLWLALGLLITFLLLAAFLTWLESFRQMIQAEDEAKTSVTLADLKAALSPTKTRFRHHRGWHTHHYS